jgi:hypothetical protein
MYAVKTIEMGATYTIGWYDTKRAAIAAIKRITKNDPYTWYFVEDYFGITHWRG